MTTNEAYEAVLDVVKEIQAAGVRVDIRPSKAASNPDLVKQCSGPERVSPDKWVHVTFHVETPEQSALLREKAKKIGWLGVCFDSGGGSGQMDWELDWSFRYDGKPDADHEAAKDMVDDLLDDAEGKVGEAD